MAEILGSSHLASAGWEIQRTNNFEVSIAGFGDNSRLLTLSVISGSLPSESNNAINISYGNTEVKVAGKYTIQAGNLVVRDFLQKDMEALVESWRAEVYNKETDAIGFASNYKRQARVTQFAPDGTHERVWKLEGVWPSSVNYGQISNENPSLKEIDITLEYDKAILDRNV